GVAARISSGWRWHRASVGQARATPAPTTPNWTGRREMRSCSSAVDSQPPAQRGQRGRWPVPFEIVDSLEHRDVRAKCRELTEEQRQLAIVRERSRKRCGARHTIAPRTMVVGNGIEVPETREHGGGRL